MQRPERSQSTKWQQQVAAFARRYGLLHDLATHMPDLLTEVREVAKEMLLATNDGQRPPQFRPEPTGEIGDALHSLLILAEACDMDAHPALSATPRKYAH
jgi:hypothetical protein